MPVLSDKLTDGAKLGRGAQIRFTVRAIRDSTAHDAILVQSRTVVDVDAATGAFTTPNMDPGPYVCEIRWGAAQPFEKFAIVIPEESETLRLWPLIDDLIPYTPPVVSLVKQYRDQAQQASAIAVAATEGVAGIGEDLEQIAQDRAAAELARDEARDSAEGASASRGHAESAASAAGDSATLAGQHESAASGHASVASDSATAAGQSETAAGQHKAAAEAAAELAVETAAGIQDVAEDAAQVALDRIAVAEDRDVVALDRQAADDARGAVEIARGEAESFAAIAGAAAAVAVEQAEGGPIELAMAVSAAEFGVPGTGVWYSIPGLDVTVTTGDRPAYVSVDFGIVVTDGVTRPVTSLSPRIWDDTAGVSLATGYMQALNPLPNSDPQYLLTQPPSLGVRLPAGWTNHRLLVQVQIPGDQAGPSWQFNTNWIPTQSSIRVVAT